MSRRRGFRWRLVVTFVALVALTAALLGIGAYTFVSVSLRDRLLDESAEQAQFNIAVLASGLSESPDAAEFAATGLEEAFRLREAETVVDFGDGDPWLSSLSLRGAVDALDPRLHDIVERGELAYGSATVEGVPYLVVAGRRLPAGPDFYFFFPAAAVEDALGQLARALAAGALVALLVAIVAAGAIARGVLRPVREASAAAARIGAGDLATRLAVASGDEFGDLAAAFNRMAASLETTVAALHAAQAEQRRFVADVSHELRTPLTALVNEAAMLRGRLGTLDRDGRRVGELLVADVARLRTLVEDLMELSRLDAAAEPLDGREVELGRFMRAVVERRSPGALVRGGAPIELTTDARRLERIVANLVDNARDHAAGHGVEVGWRLEGHDTAVVWVADRGPGVAPESLPHLFDRFYKADPSRAAGGSGLGLAIAREQALVLGGSLRGRLRDAGGMVFELRLPVTGSLPGGDRPVTGATDDRVIARPARAEHGTGREPIS
jgi:signal transduction histidine kinase